MLFGQKRQSSTVCVLIPSIFGTLSLRKSYSSFHRGSGVFQRSISALHKLNEVGYGQEGRCAQQWPFPIGAFLWFFLSVAWFWTWSTIPLAPSFLPHNLSWRQNTKRFSFSRDSVFLPFFTPSLGTSAALWHLLLSPLDYHKYANQTFCRFPLQVRMFPFRPHELIVFFLRRGELEEYMALLVRNFNPSTLKVSFSIYRRASFLLIILGLGHYVQRYHQCAVGWKALRLWL